ncbi:MAG: T9SS type A sorting domain-containing protein [Chitinophagales bacterium]|jgi:hypothetical protein|nr:T9SS type A sorting domain-containing protein [Bacteroidota bacterium]MBP8754916.1 T9SS type A sorting domain-containing protein [Chitinophagales bacterium]MBP9221207.1 T9SS type A sorting domain-containing protein [Chitinophagales bacterium]MBP9795617.1 T9SS type A sorting domain-containing protein [Chitinophagales bacterium]
MKDYQKKLLNYSSLATGIITLGLGDAQVIYTDIYPDIMLFDEMDEIGMQYLDFNIDGVNDIGLSFTTHYGCGYCPTQVFFNLDLTGSNNIAADLAGPCYLSSTYTSSTVCIIPAQNVAKVFAEGEIVSEFNSWDQIDEIFDSNKCGMFGGGCIQGEFDFNSPKQFLAFQIINIDTNYCWLRLAWEGESLFMKDFACSSTPDDSIFIQDKIADEVRDLVLIKDSCTGGTDELKVKFKPPLDEETVSEYRIMVAPSYGFNPNSALIVAPENYVSVLPTGNDIEIRLPKNFPNYLGEELPPFTDIKITVVSISKFPITNECSLVRSLPAQFGLDSYPETPDDLSLTATTLAYDPSDLFLSHEEVFDTSQSSAFRIFIVNGVEWYDFSLAEAEAIAPANYIEIPPLFNFNFQLPENMKRWNGDAMEPDTYYRAFILVMYKDGIKCANKLSDVSNYASFKANPNSIENVLQDFNIFYREDLIVISSVRSIQGTVCVFDLKGALVFENEIFANDIKIPFAQPPGIYIVKLETETGIYRQKIFVQ